MPNRVEALGRTRWIIPEGWIPSWSRNPLPALESHETACILNTGDVDAHVRITLFFEDRDPAGPYELTVGARRTCHQRFNELDHPEKVPIATNYSSVIESDVPIIVQHTRLDSRSPYSALLSTIAYPA